MSNCPRDFLGKYVCQIVPHPDRPEAESYCIQCSQKFVKKNSEEWFWFLMIAAVLLVLLLAGCEKQANRLLIQIKDASSSALQNSEQTKLGKEACFAVADIAKTGDKQALIQVNQEAIATDPQPIKDRSQAYRICHQKSQPKGQGTYVCPALKMAEEMSDRSPRYSPFIVLQIQANEGEQFCPQTLQKFAQKLAKRQGKLVIVGSTNDGNTGFNSQLWQTLKSLPNTQFCSTNARSCVKESLQTMQN